MTYSVYDVLNTKSQCMNPIYSFIWNHALGTGEWNTYPKEWKTMS